ncbi:MAG: hypothetical protein KGZ41_07370, partial [Dethiobacter sp.]|nr:hypothetical protein [Dethiobacter sp.]
FDLNLPCAIRLSGEYSHGTQIVKRTGIVSPSERVLQIDLFDLNLPCAIRLSGEYSHGTQNSFGIMSPSGFGLR